MSKPSNHEGWISSIQPLTSGHYHNILPRPRVSSGLFDLPAIETGHHYHHVPLELRQAMTAISGTAMGIESLPKTNFLLSTSRI